MNSRHGRGPLRRTPPEPTTDGKATTHDRAAARRNSACCRGSVGRIHAEVAPAGRLDPAEEFPTPGLLAPKGPGVRLFRRRDNSWLDPSRSRNRTDWRPPHSLHTVRSACRARAPTPEPAPAAREPAIANRH